MSLMDFLLVLVLVLVLAVVAVGLMLELLIMLPVPMPLLDCCSGLEFMSLKQASPPHVCLLVRLDELGLGLGLGRQEEKCGCLG